MVIGAMHIHIAILLFGLDQWFLERNIFGHACMVSNHWLLLLLLLIFIWLVTYISFFWWIFSDIWFDVFKNLTSLSNIYISWSTITSFESLFVFLISNIKNSIVFSLASTRSLSLTNMFVYLQYWCYLCFYLGISWSTFDWFQWWTGKNYW